MQMSYFQTLLSREQSNLSHLLHYILKEKEMSCVFSKDKFFIHVPPYGSFPYCNLVY
jgi:hypothetical protein